MKKIMFTIVWMFAFFIMGTWIFGGIGAVIGLFLHQPYNEALDKNKLLAAGIVAWLCCIGLPILALILGIRGKLPGTRRKNEPHSYNQTS
ncbi:MAG TPA: hypothetical protein VK810_04985 [Dongiaceae bacterium]|jgi:hypothetical protein|nr:hypothetical protein [Dongiaceae bacterium]